MASTWATGACGKGGCGGQDAGGRTLGSTQGTVAKEGVAGENTGRMANFDTLGYGGVTASLWWTSPTSIAVERIRLAPGKG